jgi:hypothetical protein
MAHAQAFMLPAQQGSDASMGAISQRSDSMGSIRSEDSCDNQSGACYDHLERHSPTSLLPEHPFSLPVLKVNSLLPQPEYTTPLTSNGFLWLPSDSALLVLVRRSPEQGDYRVATIACCTAPFYVLLDPVSSTSVALAGRKA